MKNTFLIIGFIALCIAFGILALVQDKTFAVFFAVACISLMAFVEISNKK